MSAVNHESILELLSGLANEGVRVKLFGPNLNVESRQPIPREITDTLKTRKSEIVRALQIKETGKKYLACGWVQIWSGYLKESIYLVRNKKTKVPDSSLPKYTEKEIMKLYGLTLDELRTLHEAKVIFKGEIL